MTLTLLTPPYFAHGQADEPVAVPVATTLAEEVFRSRWVGPQADRAGDTPFTTVPTAQPVTDEEANAEFLEDLGMTPFLDAARPLRDGIRIGPVDVALGLSIGWEYSDRNASGTSTTESDDNSPFVAPSLALTYARAIGPWSVDAGYSAGLRYYTNPDYNGAGTGNQRNPFSQTGRVRVGHLGARHEFGLAAQGSYGTGFDVGSGETLTQTNLGLATDWEYVLTSLHNVGATASYSTTISSNEGNSGSRSGDGDVSSTALSAYLAYLWTGKTTLTFTLGAGGSTQNLDGGSNSSGTDGRTYAQALVGATYTPKAKMTFNAAVGVGYIEDPGVADSNSEYTGLRPVYNLSAAYDVTAKTSITASLAFEGTDIEPDYRLAVNWQPRDSTGISLAIYQDQGFSLTASDNVQVNRGAVAAITQRIFSRVELTISSGWVQVENVNLSSNNANNAASSDYTYAFASADLSWQIRDWVSAQTSVWSSTGNNNPTNAGNEPETRASISLNFRL